MAFWGVEVKPGKPFTHKYDALKGRLHISMATLGFGSSTSKSILQCNIGNRSPIYLCSLYPTNTESLQLNLELEEEADEVIFSVIGPRSIHICGYYLSSTPRNVPCYHSEEESYGEDIADTETENSDHDDDDDDYDDSFINDEAHPEVFPPSSLSNQGMSEETSNDNKPKCKKSGLRRLRKYRSVESDDDDGCSEEKNTLSDDQTKKISDDDDDDTLPISSLCKNKASERVLHQEMDDDRAAGDATHKNGEDNANNIIETTLKTDNVLVHSQTHREVEAELSDHVVDPCTVLDVGSIKKEKKKKKGKTKETKSSCNGHFIKPDNAVQDEPKMDKMTHDLLAGNEQYQEHADNKETETETVDKMLASSEVSHGQSEKPKRKRKEGSKEERINPIANGANPSNLVNIASPSAETPEKRKKRKKKEQVKEVSHLEGNIAHHEDIMNKHKSRKDAAESDDVIHKFPEGKEQHQKVTNENVVDVGAHDLPDGNQSDVRKVKKKKKSKSQGNEEVAKSAEQSSHMAKEDGNKRADAKPSHVKTLSNGLVIEELEIGIKDGKIAASGKKISVHYTGMLKGNGVVFESNTGQAPLKFRLGKGEVSKGWDVGLEGMRVGEKRRLVIPPSMMSKSEGRRAKIPPNSWLIYDLELVKVH